MLKTWDNLSMTVMVKCLISFPEVRTSANQMPTEQRLASWPMISHQGELFPCFSSNFQPRQFEVSLWKTLQSSPQGVLSWASADKLCLIVGSVTDFTATKVFQEQREPHSTLFKQTWVFPHLNSCWVVFVHFLQLGMLRSQTGVMATLATW